MTLLLAMAGLFAPVEAPGDEVVVVARRRRCDLALAGRIVGSAEFRARAAEWRAGRPVTVVVPPDARVPCLAKIMFRLADHGATRAVFVDRTP